jgi:transcriptional regulator with XRE-family HTH domain
MKEEKARKRSDEIISVANLPAEYTIRDPRKFISEMRSSFLRKARERMNLTLQEVSAKIGVGTEELASIEAGKVKATHMMILHQLSELYQIEYTHLLYLFKLATESTEEEYGIAAFHDKDLDLETEEELKKLITTLKGA